METDRTQWGKGEWQAHALAVESAYRSALDGWGVTVAELENHSSLLHQRDELINTLLESRIADLSTFTAILNLMQDELSRDSGKRKRGRPGKQEQGTILLAFIERQKPAFNEAHPESRASDPAVISWYFENLYRNLGLRPQRVNSIVFKKKLKTMCNKISDARAEAKKQARRKLPENS